MGMALRAITNNGNFFALDEGRVAIFIVIDFHDSLLSVGEVFSRFYGNWKGFMATKTIIALPNITCTTLFLSSPPEGERELASLTRQVPWGDFFLYITPHRNAEGAFRLPLRGGVGKRSKFFWKMI
jgi:hypothetical protein